MVTDSVIEGGYSRGGFQPVGTAPYRLDTTAVGGHERSTGDDGPTESGSGGPPRAPFGPVDEVIPHQ
ncbi:hypothetical protein C474_21571 [Halogeometricum pallidum JCM 14848]|uniref:Uncharacterized protein n=1 Tax=Halogeometricum pallidum JCM 14848 TaxID=1227487 RepID=M0CV79_HALPD|nr:hypothetical protein C474_21571 [Halogeometricum pallidum JCM 14848]